MDQSRDDIVDEENINFSSARNVFEKKDFSTSKPKPEPKTSKQKEPEPKTSKQKEPSPIKIKKTEVKQEQGNEVVISTATLRSSKDRTGRPVSGINESTNKTSGDHTSSKTEKSITRTSFVLRTGSQPISRNLIVFKSTSSSSSPSSDSVSQTASQTAATRKDNTIKKADAPVVQQMASSSNQSSKTTWPKNRNSLESSTSTNAIKKEMSTVQKNPQSKMNIRGSSQIDQRQILMSSIAKFDGNNLKSVPKPKEKNIFLEKDSKKPSGNVLANELLQYSVDDSQKNKSEIVFIDPSDDSTSKDVHVHNSSISFWKNLSSQNPSSPQKIPSPRNTPSRKTPSPQTTLSLQTTPSLQSTPSHQNNNKPEPPKTSNLVTASTNHETTLALHLTSGQPKGITSDQPITGDEVEDEQVMERLFLKNWDPTKLVKEIYKINCAQQFSIENKNSNISIETCRPQNNTLVLDALQPSTKSNGVLYINKSGYMECLPISKTKDTLLKTWKQRFFKTQDGSLTFYEGMRDEKEAGRLELSGGKIGDIGPRMLGIQDGAGHYLVVRCSSEHDAAQWKASIQSQMSEDISSRWVKPILLKASDITHKQNKGVVIIELGSSSVRAGALHDSPALPAVYFPTVVATDLETKQKTYGFDAFKPDIRSNSILSYPVKPSSKVDKYSLEWESLPGLFLHVFKQLKLEPQQCSVLFSAPTNFNSQIRSEFMNLFFNILKVKSAAIINQTLLSFYSYQVNTGLVVDVGERIEILPVIDGFVVEGAVTRLPCGGNRIRETFNSFLTGRKYRFSNDAEFQLVRHASEKMCYVSTNYKEDFENCLKNSQSYRASLPLNNFDLPPEAAEPVTCDLARFLSTEGFFNMSLWGLDSPSLPQMVQKAISLCPIDHRRQMWRNIYLSGGVTMLENFKERLEAELTKLVPPQVSVQVHASPYRCHASFVGACVLADMEDFKRSFVTMEDWNSLGRSCLINNAAY